MSVRRSLVLIALTLALTFLCRGVLPQHTLPAQEVDTLASGLLLAHELVDDGALKHRLRRGFGTRADDPRLKGLSGRRGWARELVQAPLPRWTAALGICLGPAEESTIDRARWAAALAFALTILCMAIAGKGRPLWTVTVTFIFALMPGALAAATGSGAMAVTALSSAILLLAMLRFRETKGGALAVGVAWGLCLACHPGALWLVIPIFVATAIHRTPTSAPKRGGLLALPEVPISLLLVPIVGLLFLVALWPTLWSESTRDLYGWFSSHSWTQAPQQQIAEITFNQVSDRAPQAWTAVAQWVSWTPLTILVAWLVGFAKTLKAGREGAWFPVLMLVTLAFAGSLDGGLFHARLNLLGLMWVPTAWTAAIGVQTISSICTQRGWLNTNMSGAVIAGIVLCWPATMILSNTPPGGDTPVGAQLLEPVPMDALDHIASVQPDADIYIASSHQNWPYLMNILYEVSEHELGVSTQNRADWIMVFNRDQAGLPSELKTRLASLKPTFESQVYGLNYTVYRQHTGQTSKTSNPRPSSDVAAP